MFLAAVVVVALPGVAPAAIGEWQQGAQARVRLVAGGVDAAGNLSAALEIALPAGWHTYWRSPGDAGVPTMTDFSASTNLGPVAVSFPVPTRDDDGYAVTNVYNDGVVLPLAASVADRGKPTTLSVDIKLGVCQQVCVPDEVQASLIVPAGENDAAAASEIAKAAALLPGAPLPGTFAIDSVRRVGGTEGRPIFQFTGVVPDAAHADFFVEGPADWAPFVPEPQPADGGKAIWNVQFSRLGSTIPIAGANLRVTIRSAGKAIDQTVAVQ
jgi:DsbC/DsbD-like thiol-disulfide interchange protein